MNLEPRRIVVLLVGGLSETTLGLPALRSLREHFKQATIVLATSASTADLARLGECADEILPIARVGSELLSPTAVYRSILAWRRLGRSAFDLAIELQKSPESSLMLQFINAEERLSVASRPKRGSLLALTAERIVSRITGRTASKEHLAQRYLRLLEPLGVRPVEAEPRLTSDREADLRMEKWFVKNGVRPGELLVGLHPGSGSRTERWPVDRFASIGSRLVHNFNARVIVIAGPSERGLARRLVKLLPERRALTLHSPPIPDLVAVLARLSVLVANHTGPAHVAAALRTPVVTLSATSHAPDEDVLARNHIAVRDTAVDIIPEEDVYNAACRLIKLNRADVLRAL